MLNIKNTVLLVFAALTVNDSSASDKPTMSCIFNEFIELRHAAPSNAQRSSINQTMRLVGGVTDNATLSLDGKYRATNSQKWMRLVSNYSETVETVFIGDFGEVLTIAHDLRVSKKPLHGRFKSSLVSTGVDHTHVMMGQCNVE
jgi:hypothetical protein